MDTTQVQALVDAAFPDRPIPGPETLIRHLTPRDLPGEEAIRTKLAGREWRSLPPEFLAEEWASFCYLSAIGYRYYLPALLTAALRDFRQDSDLLHSVVFGLIPSFWYLYYEGEDHMHRDQQSALTPDQYRAVCAFLGLVFDWHPGWRHDAAQALHWGWNQIPTPALDAANRYYDQMHHYTYPEARDPEIAVLCREIETAFADTPYPGDNNLCGSMQGDEPAEYAMDFRGMRWQEANPALLQVSGPAVAFLTAEGLRYFLPAFLRAHLLSADTGIEVGDNIFTLTYGFRDMDQDISRQYKSRQKPIDWRAYGIERFAGYPAAERLAIIHYLEYQARDEYSPDGIHQALESYWYPSLEDPSVPG